MSVIGIVSIRAIRRRLRREPWWLIHPYTYLALAISFAHVLALGPSFVGHPLTQIVWSVAWAATAGVVLCYRFGLPVARSLRHRLVVTEVRPEGPGVVSVICTGRHLDKLARTGAPLFFCPVPPSRRWGNWCGRGAAGCRNWSAAGRRPSWTRGPSRAWSRTCTGGISTFAGRKGS